MKRKVIIKLVVVFGVSAVVVYVVAQSFVGQRQADKLTTAIVVLSEGRLEQAKELLSRIGPGDPAYPAAQRYLALCLHEAGDWGGFLKLTEQMDLTAPVVPAEIREELAFRQIDALFRARKFEEIFGRIEAFQQRYPGSGHLAAVTEYRLASLFERGMKKAYEGAALTDPTKSAARWAEATANLTEFLAMASDRVRYTILAKRDLKEEIWSAFIALGQEDSVSGKIAPISAGELEKFLLLRVKLHLKLEPESYEANLAWLEEFLTAFPDSRHRSWIEWQITRLNFKAAEALYKEAFATEQTSQIQFLGELEEAASRYLRKARAMVNHLIPDEEAGVSSSDMTDLRVLALNSYCWERNYVALAVEAGELMTGSGPLTRDWLVGKLFYGIALANLGPETIEHATAQLDEVLACGFTGDAPRDILIVAAAKWRSYIALKSNDLTTAQTIAAWVENGNCAKHLKESFVRLYNSFPKP